MAELKFRVRKIEDRDKKRIIIFNYELYRHLSSSLDADKRKEYFEMEIEKIERAVKDGTGFIAEFSGSPQGYVLLNLRQREVLIEDLYVHTFLRGQDIGRELVKTAAKEANRRASILSVVLFDREHPFYRDSLRFYSKLGFRQETNSLKLVLRGNNLVRLLFQKN